MESLGENWMPESGDVPSMDGEGIVIRITVRSPKLRKEFDLIDTATVKELKEHISVEFSAALDQQCIIFAGKILKDFERLRDCGVTDGMTVHLIIKSAHRATDFIVSPGEIGKGAPLPPADLGATPFGLGSVGGLAGLSNIGMGSANFIDLQQSLQKELYRNPRLLLSLMSNPLVDQITASPGLMHELLTANPQMRELMERNPEIEQMLSNSELMTQMLDVARNPAMLRELLRPQDRPLTLANDGTDAETTGKPGDEAGGVKEGADGKKGAKGSTAGAGRTTSIPTVPSDGSVFSEPSVRSLLLQMLDQPQLMTNILQSPYMQSMLQYMSSNPQLMSQMLNYNHVFANNPALQEQLQRNIPTLCQQLGSNEIQSMVTNPRALQAMLQIQEGLEQLRSAAPEYVERMGIVPPASITTTATDQQKVDPYAQFLTYVLSTNAAQSSPTTPDVERYSIQLSQMNMMGFTEPESNLQALVATSGNVNEAINRLLQARKTC